MKGLFVIGTDTGAGKTVIVAALGAVLRKRGMDVGVSKPIATGAVRLGGKLVSSDAAFLRSIVGVDDSMEEICPLIFEMPAAPNVAARRENRTVEVDRIRQALTRLSARHDYILIEGIGGWRVPITDTFTVRELAVELNLPVLVAARAGLGTINHTVLTVEAVRSMGLPIVGVVMVRTRPGDDPTAATNPEQIENLTGINVLGTVPFDPELSVQDGRTGNVVKLVEEHVDIDRIAEAIKQTDSTGSPFRPELVEGKEPGK